MKLTRLFAALLTTLTVASWHTAEAKIFRNAYVSFELPEKWNCSLEQTEWVCRTNDPGLAEAIIVLTAKEVGPQDALPGYESHLKQPRTIVTRAGSSVQSTVYKVEQKKIANHVWIDGMHFSSEVYNFYTRYLATAKDKIAVLVTFSAHKLHYTKYSGDFFRAIESLRVIAMRSTMNGVNQAGGEVFGGNLGDGAFPAEPGGLGIDGLGGAGGPDAIKSFLAVALICAAVGIYLMIKRKGKSKGKKKR
jgi:hypothetical protein